MGGIAQRSLSGKVAVVTGASRGIGKGIALALAEKAGVDRMARDMAIELKPHSVASLSLWQGFTHTERAQENLKTVAGMASQLNSAAGTSVEFPGRVIAALASDPEVTRRSGGTFISAELAEHYGITDIDGRVIPSLRAQRGAPIWMPV
jgi:NAD(P)-dependent dehydrogenase (short-subunit alcohol dehydrogenase family)